MKIFRITFAVFIAVVVGGATVTSPRVGFANPRHPKSGLKHRVVRLERENAALTARVEALEAALTEVQTVLQFVRVEPDEINGLDGPHWIVEGANVHIQSGSGSTDDGCDPETDPNCTSLTAHGNLIIGYNEPCDPGTGICQPRTGSHNLVVGPSHSYNSLGGLVAGTNNAVTNAFGSVTGGGENVASGFGASVTAGGFNVASGEGASVSGGGFNVASGFGSSISGGANNQATIDGATVGGGFMNVASGLAAAVSGGSSNIASGVNASVSGGLENEASEFTTSVSGGTRNQATANGSSISGGLENRATAPSAYVGGGLENVASASRATVSGGYRNVARGDQATVGGGSNRTASGTFNWRAGSLFQSN